MDVLLRQALQDAAQRAGVPLQWASPNTVPELVGLVQQVLDRTAASLVATARRERQPLSLSLAQQTLTDEHGACCDVCRRHLHAQDSTQQAATEFVPSYREEGSDSEEEELDLR